MAGSDTPGDVTEARRSFHSEIDAAGAATPATGEKSYEAASGPAGDSAMPGSASDGDSGRDLHPRPWDPRVRGDASSGTDATGSMSPATGEEPYEAAPDPTGDSAMPGSVSDGDSVRDLHPRPWDPRDASSGTDAAGSMSPVIGEKAGEAAPGSPGGPTRPEPALDGDSGRDFRPRPPDLPQTVAEDAGALGGSHPKTDEVGTLVLTERQETYEAARKAADTSTMSGRGSRSRPPDSWKKAAEEEKAPRDGLPKTGDAGVLVLTAKEKVDETGPGAGTSAAFESVSGQPGGTPGLAGPEYFGTAADETSEPEVQGSPLSKRERTGGVRRGGILPPLVGGVFAAGVGFAAALILDQQPSADIAALQRQITDLRQELNAAHEHTLALEERVNAFNASAAPGEGGSETGPASLADRISALEESGKAISERFAELERVVGANGEAAVPGSSINGIQTGVVDAVRSEAARLAAVDEELRQNINERIDLLNGEVAAIRGILDEHLRSAEEMARAADEAENRALTQALASDLEAAVRAGRPFSAELRGLAEVTGEAPPDALSGNADEGIPSLIHLRESFPDAARAALGAAAVNDPGAGFGARIGAFLRNQTGARSLEAREGGDPDAVLSRAEAAVRGGDLEMALREIELLPDAARAEFSDWIDAARARLDALSALAAISPDPDRT